MLTFSWEELDEVLRSIAASQAQGDMVGESLERIRTSQCSRLEQLRLVVTLAHLIQVADPAQVIANAKLDFQLH